MKKYFAITYIVLSASSVFFFAQAQQPLDPVTAAQQRAVDSFKQATDVMIARAKEFKEAEKKRIRAVKKEEMVEANNKKPVRERLTEEQLNRQLEAYMAIVENTIDVGTAAGTVVLLDETSMLCTRVADGVAKCDLTPEGRKAMGDMIHDIALAAVARGEGRVGDIKNIAEAYAGQKIAANEAAVYRKMVADALGKIQMGDRMLRGGISEAQMKLFATGWLVNSPFNLGGWGRPEWNAGSVAVLVGKQGQPLLKEIQDWTAQINTLIAGAEAGIRRGDGSYTEEDLKRDMASVQTLLSNIQNNSEIILSLIYKDVKTGELTDAMKNLVMTNAAAANALRTYGPAAITAVNSVNEAMRQMKSAEVRTQMEMLGKILDRKVNINKPLEEQIRELNPRLPAAGTGNGSAPMPPKPPAVQVPTSTVTINPATGQPVRYVFNGRDFVPMPANVPLPPLYDITKITVNGQKVWAIVPRN